MRWQPPPPTHPPPLFWYADLREGLDITKKQRAGTQYSKILLNRTQKSIFTLKSSNFHQESQQPWLTFKSNNSKKNYKLALLALFGVISAFLCPRHSKNDGGALSVTPVCPFVIKIWCPLNNFWKTASIQFKFGMLIYNIETQVEFDLGY